MPSSNFDAIGYTFRGDGNSCDVLDATMAETGHALHRLLLRASVEEVSGTPAIRVWSRGESREGWVASELWSSVMVS